MTTEGEFLNRKVAVEAYLSSEGIKDLPKNLQDASHHIVNFGGKRLRPILLLTIASSYGAFEENAISAAAAIELFHNFTLVHDDIMDKAEVRRGQAAVHKEFGIDKAIITGDALVPNAINLIRKGNLDKSSKLIDCLINTGIKIMDGQSLDIQFESSTNISTEEYIHMIGLKTSVLFGAACKLGAIIGGAPESDQKELHKFGFNLGLAFQIMDDYLDTFGDESFGKKIGGDILLNKKTFLLVRALEIANDLQRKKINDLFSEQDDNKKISQFQNLFTEMKIQELAQNKMKELHDLSLEHLNNTGLTSAHKAEIVDFAQMMLRRNK